jgi:hypothetical protein
MSEIIYRKALSEDACSISLLVQTIYPNGYSKDWYNECNCVIKKPLDGFFLATTRTDRIVGCAKLSHDYWSSVDVSYLESLMVHPNFRKRGIASNLVNLVKNESDRSIISLDRSSSLGMMLNLGFDPVAFLPEREYFGDHKESLMMVQYPVHHVVSSFGDGLLNTRIKEKNGQTYLLEIVGRNLTSDNIDRVLDLHDNPSYVQIINQRNITNDLFSFGNNHLLGSMPLDEFTTLDIGLILDSSVVCEDFPSDFNKFENICANFPKAKCVLEKNNFGGSCVK